MEQAVHDSAALALDGVQIRFGEVVAVKHADLAIDSGEFFTLLGPSGCGKTTLLRAIAGFNRHTQGSIRLGDTVVDDIPAYSRDTGMVFQNYAIFPHLNVWQNVAYGLKKRKVPKDEADRRVREALAMVDLEGYEQRMPKQLSGGQQQRVVIARAVVIRPRVLLMDEPLANLDAKLRVRLRQDLKELQAKLGITTIYVTHDQEEALSLSDRIAVMSAGEILQVGTPEQIYRNPVDLRVAEFIGEGTFLRGRGTAEGAGTLFQLPEGGLIKAQGNGSGLSGEVWLGFRPQDAVLCAPEAEHNGLTGTVVSRVYFGAYVRLELDCGLDRPVLIQVVAGHMHGEAHIGSTVAFDVAPENVMVFPGELQEGEL